eukprot:Polyplicarium_translucidae@DN203_c0_g1_i1.p1
MEAYWTPERGVELAQEYRNVLLIAIFSYYPVIWGIQRYMKDKKPYSLTVVYFLWNLSLSIFSGFGVVMMVKDRPSVLWTRIVTAEEQSPAMRLAMTTFMLTKAVEFGDTILLALRKKPTIFLHTYHHFSVALYGLHGAHVSVSFGHQFGWINMAIHTGMYLYYAAAVVIPRHSFLRAVRPYITSTQLVQMFVGMYICWSAARRLLTNPGEILNAKLGFLMFASYAYLFGRFYLDNYVWPKSSNRAVKEKA